MDLPLSVLEEFEAHRTRLSDAARQRRDLVAFKNVVDDKQERSAISIVDTLGKRQPGDIYHGDMNLRTLRSLLTMIDQRGWERSPHQLQFHQSFEKCVSRVLYRNHDEWTALRPAIMRHNGWERASSEVMIRRVYTLPSLHNFVPTNVLLLCITVHRGASGRLSGLLRALLRPVTCRRLVIS